MPWPKVCRRGSFFFGNLRSGTALTLTGTSPALAGSSGGLCCGFRFSLCASVLLLLGPAGGTPLASSTLPGSGVLLRTRLKRRIPDSEPDEPCGPWCSLLSLR
uniref:Putative secreted protein n=1 Tax=Ixodes ricinus TaxID=34613 RepID=A0A6B0U7C9_IXORI